MKTVLLPVKHDKIPQNPTLRLHYFPKQLNIHLGNICVTTGVKD
jgi:hypothetical protein